MTENDNIRHYIGDLETTEDIDVVFKHIYDLMLANGGEGSGLNADMLDGFHASDFAPITLKDELVNCIQSIEFQGDRYTGTHVILKQVIANLISVQRRDYDSENQDEMITTDVEAFLQYLDDKFNNMNEVLGALEEIQSLFEEGNNQEALVHIITNNIKEVIGEEEALEYYLDSDSVNGLAFQLISQEDYDLLPNAIKQDPRNVFIINDDINNIDEGEYVPPSLLRASMNLEFRIRDMNIEYSIDNGQTWKIMLPLVGVETNKGVLYPDWFSVIRDVMQDEDLLDQEDYPFLLNTSDNLSALQSNKVQSIKFGQNNIVNPDSNGVADIETVLGRFLNNWLSSQYSDIEGHIDIPDVSGFEEQSNKVNEIIATGNTTQYPSTKAIVDYISAQINLLTTEVNKKENASDMAWKAIPNFGYTFKTSSASSSAPYPKTVTGSIYGHYNKNFTILTLDIAFDASKMSSTSAFFTLATIQGVEGYLPNAIRGGTIYSDTEAVIKGSGNSRELRVRNTRGNKGTSMKLQGYLIFPRITVNGSYI